MASRGFGKSSPRVRGISEEARERNRRVEIGIIDTSIHYGEETQ
jgi:outer membrane protein OmpA-like peptidoglycan-associated protein